MQVFQLYRDYFGIIDQHNALRQGMVSMSDVWETFQWENRDFGESLGFIEVNTYLGLKWWHPLYKTGGEKSKDGHQAFRRELAKAILDHGKQLCIKEEEKIKALRCCAMT